MGNNPVDLETRKRLEELPFSKEMDRRDKGSVHIRSIRRWEDRWGYWAGMVTFLLFFPYLLLFARFIIDPIEALYGRANWFIIIVAILGYLGIASVILAIFYVIKNLRISHHENELEKLGFK